MVEVLTIIAGIKQFGLAPDGSDLRDLEVGFADRERQIAELRAERDCDPDGCKAHIDAFRDRAEAAEAENARLRALPLKEADEISPYEWLAQEFERLVILRKMWTADEVAATIRRHDIERDAQPLPLKDEVERVLGLAEPHLVAAAADRIAGADKSLSALQALLSRLRARDANS